MLTNKNQLPAFLLAFDSSSLIGIIGKEANSKNLPAIQINGIKIRKNNKPVNRNKYAVRPMAVQDTINGQ